MITMITLTDAYNALQEDRKVLAEIAQLLWNLGLEGKLPSEARKLAEQRIIELNKLIGDV